MENENTKPKNKPVKEIVMKDCKATIWKNPDHEDLFVTTITRSYKDKDGNWHNSTANLNGDSDSIQHAIFVLEKALEYINSEIAKKHE